MGQVLCSKNCPVDIRAVAETQLRLIPNIELIGSFIQKVSLGYHQGFVLGC